jgi:hypothetical protein
VGLAIFIRSTGYYGPADPPFLYMVGRTEVLHLAGGRKVDEFLDWCGELGIPYVTLWLLSTENLDRASEEVSGLLRIIGETVTRIAEHPRDLRTVGRTGSGSDHGDGWPPQKLQVA